MNLNQLKYFHTLAKYEHYTKAAKDLYISQPSLSYAIKELEKELGVPLFEKKGRNVILTSEGKLFYLYVDDALTSISGGIEAVKGCVISGNINAAVIPTMSASFFPNIMIKFKGVYPHVDFRLSTQNTMAILNSVRNKEVDIGICSKLDNYDDLKFIPVYFEELVLIANKDHPISKKEHPDFADIVKYPLISYKKEISIYRTIMKFFTDRGLTPQVLYELDDENSIGGMVDLNFGIAIAANNGNLSQFHNINKIKLNISQDSRTVYLVYNPLKHLGKAAKAFISYMDEHKPK